MRFPNFWQSFLPSGEYFSFLVIDDILEKRKILSKYLINDYNYKVMRMIKL